MASKATRVRTESMVQRLSKQPMSEGFELMDKGYTFGALRLFQFKVETSPPFQVAPCLDALATLLLILGETDEFVTTLELAVEKYKLVQNPILAKVMQIRIADVQVGSEVAAGIADEAVASIGEVKDPKTKGAAGRLYHTRAEIRASLGKVTEAIEDLNIAIGYSWERVHLSHGLLGDLRRQQNDNAGAMASYECAIAANKSFVQAYMSLIPLLREAKNNERALELCTKVQGLRPSCALVKERAFTLSEMGNDVEAIDILNTAIRNPPHDETEAHMGIGNSVVQLHKAKCAIYADLEKYIEASDSITCALAVTKEEDPEAKRMYADLQEVISKDYLQRTQLTPLLDALVEQTLAQRPKNVEAFLLKLLENGKV